VDPVNNPFAPGAGTFPPELAGRDGLLSEVAVALERVKLGYAVRGQVFVGLRGVGKTVLLNKVEEMALASGFETISVEAHEDKSLPAMLVPSLRKLLLRLDARASLSDKTKMGLRVLRSFIGRFRAKFKVSDVGEIELGVDPEVGVADSGDLESDLPDLLVALAEAAKDRGTQVCLLIDELQYLKREELSALIMSLHRISQKKLPMVMFAAGLPLILGLAGRSKSYAERLFAFPALGPLSGQEARKAIEVPVRARGCTILVKALDEIVLRTQGYPYFLQQWGYEAWNAAATTRITLVDVMAASQRALKQLDESFFRVRFDRLTPREKEYLFAMAALGGSQQRSGDIAEKLGFRANSLGPLRSKLIAKGMIYSPAHGDNAFTVPLFEGFLKRQL
jgi:hypothetical protein